MQQQQQKNWLKNDIHFTLQIYSDYNTLLYYFQNNFQQLQHFRTRLFSQNRNSIATFYKYRKYNNPIVACHFVWKKNASLYKRTVSFCTHNDVLSNHFFRYTSFRRCFEFVGNFSFFFFALSVFKEIRPKITGQITAGLCVYQSDGYTLTASNSTTKELKSKERRKYVRYTQKKKQNKPKTHSFIFFFSLMKTTFIVGFFIAQNKA